MHTGRALFALYGFFIVHIAMCRVLVYGEDTEIHIAGVIDMKKLTWLSVEDYGTTVMEIIVASAMKGYLRRMSEEEALQSPSPVLPETLWTAFRSLKR